MRLGRIDLHQECNCLSRKRGLTDLREEGAPSIFSGCSFIKEMNNLLSHHNEGVFDPHTPFLKRGEMISSVLSNGLRVPSLYLFQLRQYSHYTSQIEGFSCLDEVRHQFSIRNLPSLPTVQHYLQDQHYHIFLLRRLSHWERQRALNDRNCACAYKCCSCYCRAQMLTLMRASFDVAAGKTFR